MTRKKPTPNFDLNELWKENLELQTEKKDKRQKLRFLLASGLRGSQYKKVLREYIKLQNM